jgi:hypothetical protein
MLQTLKVPIFEPFYITQVDARKLIVIWADYVRKCNRYGLKPNKLVDAFTPDQIVIFCRLYPKDLPSDGEDNPTISDSLQHLFIKLADYAKTPTSIEIIELKEYMLEATQMLSSWEGTQVERQQRQYAACLKLLHTHNMLDTWCPGGNWSIKPLAKTTTSCFIKGLHPAPFKVLVEAHLAINETLSKKPALLFAYLLQLAADWDKTHSPVKLRHLSTPRVKPFAKPNTCTFCRQTGHLVTSCFAKRRVDLAEQQPATHAAPSRIPIPQSTVTNFRCNKCRTDTHSWGANCPLNPQARYPVGNSSAAANATITRPIALTGSGPSITRPVQVAKGTPSQSTPGRAPGAVQSKPPQAPTKDRSCLTTAVQALHASGIDFVSLSHDGQAEIYCPATLDGTVQPVLLTPVLFDSGSCTTTITTALAAEFAALNGGMQPLPLPAQISLSSASGHTTTPSTMTAPVLVKIHFMHGAVIIGPLSLMIKDVPASPAERLLVIGRHTLETRLGINVSSLVESHPSYLAHRGCPSYQDNAIRVCQELSVDLDSIAMQHPHPTPTYGLSLPSYVTLLDPKAKYWPPALRDSAVALSADALKAMAIDKPEFPVFEADPFAEDAFGPPMFSTVDEQEKIDALNDTIAMLEERVELALHDGLLPQLAGEVREILHRHLDTFRIKLGHDPPANVPPLRVTLKPGSTACTQKPRGMSPPAREWLRTFIATLVHYGLVRPNPQAVYSSCAFTQPKKLGGFRMLVDARELNAQTEKCPFPMPSVPEMTMTLQGARCFFLIDLFNGYWQIPVIPEDQEKFSFITGDGIWTPTRVPQGTMNATAHFQSIMQDLVIGPDHRDKTLVWVDDLLGFTKGASELEAQRALLHHLDVILTRLGTLNLKASAAKLVLYAKHVEWFGKVFDGVGVRHCPKRIEGLTSLRPPTNAGELMQFLCATNWLHAHIPNLVHLAVPLQALLQSKLGSTPATRTSKYASRSPITSSDWTDACSTAYDIVKEGIRHSITLTHPIPDYFQLLFPDASLTGGGVLLTQVPPYEAHLPVAEMSHQALAVLSRSFKGAELNYSITDKEALPIIWAYDTWPHLLWYRHTRICTDHKTLAYIFNPSLDIGQVSKARSGRLSRYACFLGRFDYDILHISGESNIWADILSRWIPPHLASIGHDHALVVAPDLHVPLTPPITVLSVAVLAAAQLTSWGSDPTCLELCQSLTPVLCPDNYLVHFSSQDDLWHVTDTPHCPIWIPLMCRDIIDRILITAHCGSTGHRGFDATMHRLHCVYWTSQRADVRAFIHDCLNCLDSKYGKKVPRPYAETVHGQGPLQVIHVDHLHVGDSDVTDASGGIYKWICVVTDDFTKVCLLEPATSPTALHTAQVLLAWQAQYGPWLTLVTDQGSNFTSHLMTELATLHGFEQHFHAANTHYPNGTVEVVCKHVTLTLKAILHDRKRPRTEWLEALKVVQYALNSAYRTRLGHSPFELLFSKPASPSNMSLILPLPHTPRVVSYTAVELSTYVKDLAAVLDVIHKKTLLTQVKGRQQSRDRESTGKVLNLAVGEYVLAARVDHPRKPKLIAFWTGPFVVTDVLSSHLYVVQHIHTSETKAVHATRLVLYHDSLMNVTSEMLAASQYLETAGMYEIARVVEYRLHNRVDEIRVAWRGFDEAEWSWEPLQQMLLDDSHFISLELAQLPLTQAQKERLTRVYAVSF